MDISRFKKLVAGLSMSALVLAQGGSVLAYSDVQSGIWYETAVNDFVDAGYLDGSQERFRGGDNALRAEFIKLIVELNGGVLGTAPATPSFDDVAVGAWYYDYFEEAGAEGWVRGDGNCFGTKPCFARPGVNINRAEASALINRAFGLVGTGLAPQFVDNPSGQWYTNDIQVAADNCVLQGDSGRGTVRPGDNMNRAEMVVMLHRVDQGLQYPDCGTTVIDPGTGGNEAGIDNVTTLSASKIEVEFTDELNSGIAQDPENYEVDGLTVASVELTSPDVVEITFDGSMAAGEDYTLFAHGETAGGEEFDDSISFLGYRDVPLSAGTLEISLNPNTPLGDTVPMGSVGVAMLSVDFTASCEDDILVDGVTLIHEGQGSQADIQNAWMSVNGGRVSRTRVFDSEDQTADLRFSRPLLIAACETVTVDFMADYEVNAQTNGRHNYVLELSSDLDSNAQQVTGTFPLRGETFEVAAVTSGVVTATYRSVTPSQVDVNDQDAVVGKFELAVDSTEDQTFYSVTMENTGTSSDGDFTDLFIRRTDGTALTDTVSQTVADYVTLAFDPPFTVLEGDKVTLEVIADIADGAADTMKLQFEETNDIFAVGSLYGYGVNGQLYGSQVTLDTAAPSTVTINAGELTIDIDGPVTDEYTPDADDVVMANIDFVTGGEDLNVNEMYALIYAQTSSGGTLGCGPSTSDALSEVVEDVQIRNTVTGQTVDGVRMGNNTPVCMATTLDNSGTDSTYAIYRFDDFVLRSSSRWALRLDFIENAGATAHPRNGDRFKAVVCTAEETDTVGCDFSKNVPLNVLTYNFDAEGLSTGDVVSDIRPGEDVSGNFQEVAVASLSVTERTLGATDTVVENSQDVALFRFEATAGKAEDVFITQIVTKADTGTLVDATDYSLWVDSDDNGSVDTILESGQGEKDNKVSFDDLVGGGYTIPAEETVLFEVHADIAGSLSRDEISLGFTDTVAGFIEAEEADDGTALSCARVNNVSNVGCTTGQVPQIVVTTATSKIYALKGQGSLYVNKDSVPTRSRQLLAGELGEAILRLELRAKDEPIDVTRLIFTNSGAAINVGAMDSINRLQLYREGESTSFASATIDNCNNISSDIQAHSFCAVMESQQLVVADGDRADILVRPLMKPDATGAKQTSSGALQFIVNMVGVSKGEGVENSTSGTGSVTARGFESSNVLLAPKFDGNEEGEVYVGTESDVAITGAETTIIANKNDVVLAKIVSIEDMNQAQDGAQVPIGENQTLAEFKFTAATNTNSQNGLNKATLSGIVFSVASSNVNFQSTGFKLYNKNEQGQKITCTASGSLVEGTSASGSFYIQCLRAGNTAVDMEMDSGDSITLVLQGWITSNRVTAGQGSALQVSLNNFSERTRTTFKASGGATATNINWTDSLADATKYFFNWIEYGQTQISSTSYQLS